MTFSGLDAALLTLTFLVPGFILDAVFSRFCSQEDAEPQVLFLRFLSFSCVNYALWFWLIYLMVRLELFYRNPMLTAIGWTVVMLVSPVVLGVSFGIMEQKRITAKLLQPFGQISQVDDTTAWEEMFANTPWPCWILVTLRDGNEVRGLLGVDSHVTCRRKGGDLYIDRVVTKDKEWEIDSDSWGMWIPGSQIKRVELWGRMGRGTDDGDMT